MNTFEFSLILWVGSVVGGFVGALAGMGGGVIIVPLLTLGFGVDIRYAAGASLVSVIATSSGAAAAYVKEGYTNLRIGMFLEIATVCGALTGAFFAMKISGHAIEIIFGVVLLLSAYLSGKPHPEEAQGAGSEDFLGKFLKMHGSYPATEGERRYTVCRVPAGFGLMYVAGCISGILGIGSGAFKVLAMDHTMRLPFKVSTTTSNFMIGVTAAASAGVYLSRGYIDPGLSMPVMLGVLTGSFLGTKFLKRTHTNVLRTIFSVVIFFLAVEMIFHGVRG